MRMPSSALMPCSQRGTRRTVPTLLDGSHMSLAMIFLTSFGLIVGLGVLYLAWRFVDNQPSEIDPRPPSPSSPPPEPDPPVAEDSEDEQKSRRMHPSTIVAMIGMALGLAAILFVLFFGPSSPLR